MGGWEGGWEEEGVRGSRTLATCRMPRATRSAPGLVCWEEEGGVFDVWEAGRPLAINIRLLW